jgi:hypothetical protein
MAGLPFRSCKWLLSEGYVQVLRRRMTIFPMIVKLQSVRPEDVRSDGRIQWDKFMRFGEILSVLSDCQARGPMVPGTPSTTFTSILKDTVIIDDEDVSRLGVGRVHSV